MGTRYTSSAEPQPTQRKRRVVPPPIDCAVCHALFKDGDQYHWTDSGWTHIDCATEPTDTSTPTNKEAS